MIPTSSPLHRLLAPLLAALLLMIAAPAQAGPEEDAALVERISSEVVRKLQEGGALDRAVDAGIERYVAKQREAQAAAARQRAQAAQGRADKVPPADPERDHIYGNPDATVSLIEYSDFECPYCKRFHPAAKALVDDSGGRVNWVYRHFPLAFHNPMAQREAEASECAAELGGNDAFWKFTDTLYERTRSNGKGMPGVELGVFAAELGLDRAAFEACLESGRHADRVKKDYEMGIALGISGTPGNILRNNETGKVLARPGAQPLARMQATVEQLVGAKAGNGNQDGD
ncbi:MAG: thioredoxin domain-containing protein [Gammaproteobacteria bacterium]|nr:thioredoxin domain-containing protein [Gammaproteobacteria bacterium]